MTRNRLAVIAGMATMALSAVGDLARAQVFEAGWLMDNAGPQHTKPRSKSKSTHKQNARKAKRGQQ